MVTTMPGLQPRRLSGANPRRLVNLQSHAVAGGVRKRLGQTLPAQNAARRLVHLRAAHARSDCIHRVLLGFQHRFVGSSLLGLWLAQENGARHIGTVTLVDYTEVERHKPPPRQRSGCGAPMRQAERTPEATIVSNDMPSAPSSRAWCSSSAATSISGNARPQTPECAQTACSPPAPPRPSPPARPHPSRSADVRQTAPARPEETCAASGSAARSSSAPARRPWFAPGQIPPSSRPVARPATAPPPPTGEPDDNLHLRGLHFFGGLRRVAAIGKQPRRPARHGQRGAGAGEPAKIANIRKMRDEEPGKPGASQLAAQRADAAEVVHGLSFITAIGNVLSAAGGSVPCSLRL